MIVNKIQYEREKQEYITKQIKELQLKKERQQKKIHEHNEKVRKLKLYNQMNINFDIKDNYNSVIPLNFYTCWHTKNLPPKMKENYDLLVKNNPEFNHYLYDEDECLQFIKDHFDQTVSNAYNKLIPASYKSDLWRFCVLYINGGIYMDIKYQCINNFKLIALTEQEYFVRDRPEHMSYTALIVVKPHNHIMLKCIKQIVDNVNNQFYGTSSLSPTGPGLLGSFFSLKEINDMPIYFTDVILENNIKVEFMVFKNTIILKYYDGYRKEQSIYQKHKTYGDFWNERKIYK